MAAKFERILHVLTQNFLVCMRDARGYATRQHLKNIYKHWLK